MNTTGKEGYWPIVQGLRPGLNDGEEPDDLKVGLANKFAEENPKFNHYKFNKACGGGGSI